jgi:signal transduction histidine kinase
VLISHDGGPGRAAFGYVRDLLTSQASRSVPEAARRAVAWFETELVASVPVRYHHQAVGRLFVAGGRSIIDVSDLDFLAHAMQTTLRLTDNVRLMDRLACDAAENERRRVARSLHDTVIQPFIGLRLGLRSIRARLDDGDSDVSADVDTLLRLVDDEVLQLRQQMTVLQGTAGARPDLMPALRRFSRRFSEVTGIDVDVEGPPNLAINERLDVELFEMSIEALSNVRRHTTGRRARIDIRRHPGTVDLRVENDHGGGDAGMFQPRSLLERSRALGGTLDVQRSSRATVVAISIPL